MIGYPALWVMWKLPLLYGFSSTFLVFHEWSGTTLHHDFTPMESVGQIQPTTKQSVCSLHWKKRFLLRNKKRAKLFLKLYIFFLVQTWLCYWNLYLTLLLKAQELVHWWRHNRVVVLHVDKHQKRVLPRLRRPSLVECARKKIWKIEKTCCA